MRMAWGKAGSWAAVAAVAAVALFAPGCASPDAKAQQAGRQQRMQEYTAWYADYDANGPDRMRWLSELGDELRTRHDQQLDEMLKQIDETYERDKKRWKKNAGERGKWFNWLTEGNPDNIEKTWGQLVQP